MASSSSDWGDSPFHDESIDIEEGEILSVSSVGEGGAASKAGEAAAAAMAAAASGGASPPHQHVSSPYHNRRNDDEESSSSDEESGYDGSPQKVSPADGRHYDEEVEGDVPPTLLNFLNIIFFLGNAAVTLGVGSYKLMGDETLSGLSDKYQTLVTPASWSFLIWFAIFALQGIFSVIQFLPEYRTNPMATRGVSFWFILVCASQIGWTFAFLHEVIPATLLLMVLLWVSLASLLVSEYYAASDGTIKEWALLKLPFSIHFGWVTATVIVNANIFVVEQGASQAVQLATAILSLVVMHSVSVELTLGLTKPDYAAGAVLGYATGGIASELSNPNPSINEDFPAETIDALQWASLAVACLVALQVVVGAIKAFTTHRYRRAAMEERMEDGIMGEDVKNEGRHLDYETRRYGESNRFEDGSDDAERTLSFEEHSVDDSPPRPQY